MHTALVCDSTAYLDAQRAADARIAVIPLRVSIGGADRPESAVPPAQLTQALRAGEVVTTSAAAPKAFAETYQRLADQGADSIVSVHVSAEMSSTIDSASVAAAQVSVPVTVIDSRTLGSAMGYAVLTGARAAASGASAQEVARLVRERCTAARVVFAVDTLSHLKRGGRIGGASALLGAALAIKPILGVERGEIVVIDRVRTGSKAVSTIIDLALQAASDRRRAALDIGVQHLDAADRAARVAAALQERLPSASIEIGELGAVVGAHVGPGVFAVAVCPQLSTGCSAPGDVSTD